MREREAEIYAKVIIGGEAWMKLKSCKAALLTALRFRTLFFIIATDANRIALATELLPRYGILKF